MVVKRGVVACCNIFFPPLAVFLLTGAREDLFINSMLFLLAVLPSHVHGFYISWTYFSRKRRIRKGAYPGKRRPMIYSEKVQNGGASSSEVRSLKQDRLEERRQKEMKKREGGRIRRLLRRVVHREPGPDMITSPKEEYYDEWEQDIPTQLSRRESSRVITTAPVISRPSTRRRTASYDLDPERGALTLQRQTSLRGNNRGSWRNSTAYANEQALVRRQTSVRSPQMRIESVEYRPDLTRRHTMQGRASSNRRLSRRNSNDFADYVNRPALPSRPGTSWRDDINQWRETVPVAAY
jgi:uncharacterized membrane protein YqaE (UPF0057 family)